MKHKTEVHLSVTELNSVCLAIKYSLECKKSFCRSEELKIVNERLLGELRRRLDSIDLTKKSHYKHLLAGTI